MIANKPLDKYPQMVQNFILESRTNRQSCGCCTYGVFYKTNIDLLENTNFGDVCHARLRVPQPICREPQYANAIPYIVDVQRTKRFISEATTAWIDWCLNPMLSPWAKVLEYTNVIRNEGQIEALIIEGAHKLSGPIIGNFLIALRQTEEKPEKIQNWYQWAKLIKPLGLDKTDSFIISHSFTAPNQLTDSISVDCTWLSHYFVNVDLGLKDLKRQAPSQDFEPPFLKTGDFKNRNRIDSVNSVWDTHPTLIDQLTALGLDIANPRDFEQLKGQFGTYSFPLKNAALPIIEAYAQNIEKWAA